MANKKLSAIITIGGAVAGSLKGAFNTIQGNVDQVGGKLADLTRRQKMLSETISVFGRQGKDVSKFRAEYAELTKQIERTTAAQNQLNDISQRQENNRSARDELQGGLGGMIAIGAAVAVPIKNAIDFEAKMAEVKKVVNFEGTQEESNTYFAKLGDQILEMTRRLPMAAEEIAELVAAGGQGGIENNELLKFAELAGKMGVAFDISAEEAGQSMAEMKSAFGIPLDDVAILADKINYLGNTSPAAAKNILNIVQRVGALGGVAGVSSGQVAAMAATLRGMGIETEVAATGIQNFLLGLTKGEAASKSQKEALKSLGFGAKQVAGSMQKDAQQTISVILQAVKRLPRARQASVLSQLFGTESIKAIAPLLDQIDTLQENFKKVGDTSKYGGSMQAEFNAIAATTANKLKILKSGFLEASIVVGTQALPVLGELLDTVTPMIGAMTDLAKANPQATRAIVGTTAAVLSLTVAVYAARLGANYLNGAYLQVAGALTKLRVGFNSAIIGARMLSLTMSLTPIGLVVGAIAVGVALIIKYWDRIKAYSVGLWQGLTENLGPVKEAFSALGDALGPIGEAFKWLGGLVVDIGKWFIDLFKPVHDSKEELDSAGAAGKAFGKKIADGLALVREPIDWLIKSLKWVGEALDPMIEKANRVGDRVGGAVKSGWGNLTGWINEKVNGTADADSGNVPLSRPAMASRGGQVINDNSKTEIQIVQRPGENQDALAQRVADKMQAKNRSAGRANMADGWAPL